MAFEYVDIEDAIATPGLRMVVVGGIPSPWSEAAKGLFAIKGSTGRRRADEAESIGARVRALLGMFAQHLKTSDGDYLLGETLTAADVYLACGVALFAPLPESQCPMDPSIRAAYEWLDAPTGAALDPVLLEHRDRMYGEHLELPLSL